MSTTSLIALGIGVILAIGLVATLGVLSLLSGTMEFFFGSPKIFILKSKHGKNGVAFGFRFNSEKESARFDQFKIRLFNPFGSPTQMSLYRDFDPQGSSFARDIDFGEEMKKLTSAKGFNDALVELSVYSSRDGIVHQQTLKAFKFLERSRNAKMSVDDFNEKYKVTKSKPLYTIPGKSFVSPPLPKSGKALKIATNPEFASEFAAAGGAAAAEEKPNFSVSKVWIEPGCIVCDACEAIFPEVFEVTEDTCLIRPGYPTDDGLKVEEAADACPVEVIKFDKA
ncbi:MAG: hypothetical protein E2O68_01950 [Deltaproteobacteria bacterium]|nr:MAG: hypothetical protein E2O68_01950 [Deltaproteobacteria bacterium]